MQKLYAICTKEAYQKSIPLFHSQHGSHYIDLPDGRLLVTVAFHHESSEAQFLALAGVELLPDPHFEGNKQLADHHHAAVAHLKPAGKTVLDVARAAGQIHPLMKLRSWI